MKLTCICSGRYPAEHAAAIRHHLLAKGLTELGHSVEFLILFPQRWQGQTQLKQDGINFVELNHYNGSNKVAKKIHYFKAISKTKKIITQKKQNNEVDAIIVFSTDAYTNRIAVQLAQKLGIKIFCERTEFPYVYYDKPLKHKLMLKVFLNVLPRFDGVFAINDKLIEYMRQYNPNTQKVLTVVDLAFFKTSQPSPYPFAYIGYCGTIRGTKDGVPILIEAFAKITHQFPGLKLVLVGDNANKGLIKDTLDKIEAYQLQDKVVFTGHIDRDMMPVILGNAQILVVSKPDNAQNAGNFPIKIGEYLATSVPVVVTNVGEIPLFIKDGENGYLAQPNSAEAFAQKMAEALADPAKAKEAGKKGQLVAQNNFGYVSQAAVIANFIQQKLS
jgi:glycosyltransferase involved in cell wall biosynthesis